MDNTYSELKDIEQVKFFNWIIIGFCSLIYLAFNVLEPYFFQTQNMLIIFSAHKENQDLIYPIITANFLHANILHILMNLYFFKQFEKVILVNITFKHYIKLFSIVLLGSIIGIYGQIALTSDLEKLNIILGFSGVAFGIFGFIFNYFPLKIKLINIAFIIGYHALLMFYIEGVNLAWLVHLGGFGFGYIYFFIIRNELPAKF